MDAERVGRLTGRELSGLIDVLLDAYVGRDEFEMLLTLHLDKPPGTLSDDGGLKACVFKLVITAKSEGWLPDLINAAIAERPGNPKLKAWVKSVGQSTATETLPQAPVAAIQQHNNAASRSQPSSVYPSRLQDLPDPSRAVVAMNRAADRHRNQNLAASRLRGKTKTSDYDVFLCYNSKDRQAVVAIGERLKEHGILPWLDLWEIPPGILWQPELRKQLKSIRSAAVFIGPHGPGPWQDLEVQALLQQITKRSRPLIPVILEGRRGSPRLPAFLDLLHAVDMRDAYPDPFQQLIWGITGKKSPLF